MKVKLVRLAVKLAVKRFRPEEIVMRFRPELGIQRTEENEIGRTGDV